MPDAARELRSASVLDLNRVAGWLEEVGVGTGPLENPQLLEGGTQNLLVRFSCSGRDLVLRRPPEHKRVDSDETMSREARILRALAGSDVPHPRFVARCEDAAIIGATFYVMEHVDGFNPTVEMPDAYRSDAAWQQSFAEAFVDALLALAEIRPERVGLADLGRPEGWHDRQVARWSSQLERYEQIDGRRNELLEEAGAIGQWLARHPPGERRLGLIHGDFHLANVLMERDEPRLAAVIDWELSTQGDPLLDLGQLLATWPVNEYAIDVAPAGPLQDLPDTTVLEERYLSGSGRTPEDVRWFRVLACFRLAVLVEGTHARARAGRADPRLGEEAHARAQMLFRQATALIDAA